MKRRMSALVIGNANYAKSTPLANPANDATDMGSRLKSYGFDTLVAVDCSAKEMDTKLKEFKSKLIDCDVGLFFFAGHGIQIDGSNYLIATDTDTSSETDAKFSSMSLNKVLDVLDKSPVATKIVVLDACRNNPWERAWHRDASVRGLASVYAPKGTIIGFATSPGELASDGSGRNGAYTSALLQHIDTPDCSIEDMFKRVRNTVAAETKGKQTSWEHTSLSGQFYFNISLGKLIDEYDASAIADKLMVLDESKKSHRIIAGLKSHNWYAQNPAIAEFTADAANKMKPDNLFVVGRNIYQAACGGSAGATRFINELMKSTRGFSTESRKAVLDGILFEIFFDSSGSLRNKIKGAYFDDVFSLQDVLELRSSFEFISESLITAGGDFYVVPGKGHTLSATVSVSEKDGAHIVDGVYIDGLNVLRAEDNDWSAAAEAGFFGRMTPEGLASKLSEQLVVPSRNLALTYSPKTSGQLTQLKLPSGWTVSKRR